MIFTDIADNLCIWLNQIFDTNCKAIQAENIGVCLPPFVSVSAKTPHSLGRDDHQGEPDQNGMVLFSGDREFTAHLIFVGPTSPNLSQRLREGLRRTEMNTALESFGLVYVDTLLDEDITAPFGVKYENRWAMDLRMRYSQRDSEDLGYVDSVGMSGEIDGVEISYTIDRSVL